MASSLAVALRRVAFSSSPSSFLLSVRPCSSASRLFNTNAVRDFDDDLSNRRADLFSDVSNPIPPTHNLNLMGARGWGAKETEEDQQLRLDMPGLGMSRTGAFRATTPNLNRYQNLNRNLDRSSSDAAWFSDQYYSELAYDDINLRAYLSTVQEPSPKKKSWGLRLGGSFIYRFPKRSVIHLFYARPNQQSRTKLIRQQKGRQQRLTRMSRNLQNQ